MDALLQRALIEANIFLAFLLDFFNIFSNISVSLNQG